MAESRPRRQRKRLPPAKSPTAGTVRLGVVLGLLIGVNLYVFLWRGETSIPAVMEQAAMAGQEDADPRGSDVPGQPDGDEGGKGDDGDDGDDGDEDAADGAVAGGAQPGSGTASGSLPEGAEEGEGRWVEGAVESGDSLGRILRRENMTPPEADEVIRALSPHMDFRKIRPGQSYRIRFDDDGRLVEFEFKLSRTVTVRAKRNERGELVGKRNKASTEIHIREIGGTITNSLYAAVKDRGEHVGLVAFFVDVFAYDINFYTETRVGDSFRMLVEKEYAGDEFLRYRRVLAAEYSGNAGTYRAVYFQPPGANEGRYYDERGRSIEKTLLKTPLKFTRISSKFNPSRMHPILHRRRGHMGVDYAAPTGTPVRTAADGTIAFRGVRGGGGNVVIVSHDGGLQTVYMHLSKFRKGQQVGQRVAGKSVIGYVGSTGLSTGPHLHFGVKKDGRYVDPLTLHPTHRGGVRKKHRAAFNTQATKLLERLAAIPVDPRRKLEVAQRPE